MDNYQKTFETWNKVAELYQDKFMYLDLYNDTYDRFCELIEKPDPAIFEIGCGPGNITKYLLNKRPDFKIFAIDVAPKMIELARANNPTADFAVMDCRQIGSLRLKFDAIIPAGLAVIYLLLLLYFKAIGGYKAVHIAEELTGGIKGPHQA